LVDPLGAVVVFQGPPTRFTRGSELSETTPTAPEFSSFGVSPQSKADARAPSSLLPDFIGNLVGFIDNGFFDSLIYNGRQ
jgi:hypothetical protein